MLHGAVYLYDKCLESETTDDAMRSCPENMERIGYNFSGCKPQRIVLGRLVVEMVGDGREVLKHIFLVSLCSIV